MKWLELDEKLVHKLAHCDCLDAGLQLERTADWDWTLKPESRIQRWSESDLRRLRRDLPLPGIRLPTEQMLAKAVEVAEANWHHSPEPGRTAKVLGWLPPGAVLVPCHFASKKPRVYYKVLWTAREFAAYGAEQADRGNLAVKMGPADIAYAAKDILTSRRFYEDMLGLRESTNGNSLAIELRQPSAFSLASGFPNPFVRMQIFVVGGTL